MDNNNLEKNISVNNKECSIFSLKMLEGAYKTNIERLPFSIRILLEGIIRNRHKVSDFENTLTYLANWKPVEAQRKPIPFMPGRVLLQDFTGVPVIVDLAAMRSAMEDIGGDPSVINPVVPVDLVVDHSVQVDYFRTQDSLAKNAELEFERNYERYKFLNWGQKAFDNLRIIPPATGIVHQVNLEYLSSVVLTKQEGDATVAFPDTLVGTDSHTTMINGLGVVGWGVGGIEAIAAMLAQPIDILTPDVYGFELTGSLPDGSTPTDLTLTITRMLREKGVVGKFVEFYGPGLNSLTLADRAMISNMTPENGATLTYFPVDNKTLDYLKLSGRPQELIDLVEAYYKEQLLFREDNSVTPEYSDTLHLDLSTIEPSLSGPKRPQDQVAMKDLKKQFRSVIKQPKLKGGYDIQGPESERTVQLHYKNNDYTLSHGSVLIAAITSCTNTSNPFVMIAAGLLAKNAVNRGLKVKPYIKTSLAPGSKVVTNYLNKAGLSKYLDELGFNLVGYGCTTCIGNSGPLPEEVKKAIDNSGIVTAAVISGNRNFEGRVHADILANYLASPPLVVAFALAGTVDTDLTNEPLGINAEGEPIYLKDIWPTPQDVIEIIYQYVTPEMFSDNYASLLTGNEVWNRINTDATPTYDWDADSSYIQKPPYFNDFSETLPDIKDIRNARVLALLGDSITTDHISPAGAIIKNGAAGKYLTSLGIEVKDYNSYGSRRGNDQVMTRGTFGNIRLKNQLTPEREGSYTLFFPDEEVMPIFDAAMLYKSKNIPLIVLAGKDYGTGSSRDWAAKGPSLLGVKAIIAESFERIHRSNLIGMGILPLQFKDDENAASLGLTGHEVFDISGLEKIDSTRPVISIKATRPDKTTMTFDTIVRLDTKLELEYFKNGGILQTILREHL